jgi:hypothetical protein
MSERGVVGAAPRARLWQSDDDEGGGVYWLGAICFALHVIEDDLISPSCRRTRVNNLLCVLALVLSADCTS